MGAAGLVYFALVFASGFVMGAVRVPLLVPCLGVRVAELLGMPIMLVVMVISARFMARHYGVPATAWGRLLVGLIALGMLIAAELLLATALQGRSIIQYVASRDPASGSVYLAMLGVFAVTPLVLARLRNSRVLSSDDGA